MSRMLRLILIVSAMSAFLVAMVVDHNTRRLTGEEVILDLEPIDPRDILAGYFVIISTPLHRLDSQELGGDDDFYRSDDIYVVVEPSPDGSWRAVSIHTQRPDSGIFFHGKVQSPGPNQIRAHFNIERFYADEATARALEDRRREDAASMRLIVSVSRNGRAIIRGLEIGGERQIAPLL